jgi:hypothetical protein
MVVLKSKRTIHMRQRTGRVSRKWVAAHQMEKEQGAAAMAEPHKTITVLGTWPVAPGEVFAIPAGMDLDTAADVMMEDSFQRDLAHKRRLREADELFWLPDRRSETDDVK